MSGVFGSLFGLMLFVPMVYAAEVNTDAMAGSEEITLQLFINNCDLSFTGANEAVSIPQKLKLDVYDSKKKNIVTTYDFSAKDVETSNKLKPKDQKWNISKTFNIKVPSWKNGDVYYIKVNGLNSAVFGQDMIEIKWQECTLGDEDEHGNDIEIKAVMGKDVPYDVILAAKPRLVCVNVYDSNNKSIKGARAVLVDDAGKQYKGTTGNDGKAYIQFNSPKSKTLALTVDNVVNGLVYNQVNEYVYHNSFVEMLHYNLRMTEKADNYPGQLGLKSVYKNTYRTELLQKNEIPVEIVHDDIVVDVVNMADGEDAKSNYRILDNGTYGFRVTEDEKDFNIVLNPSTINIKGGEKQSVTATATPRLALKIVNTVNGKKVNNNFTVKDFGAKGAGGTEDMFDVNSDMVYHVINNDTGKEFSVTISGDYKVTTLDIGTGRILYDGKYFGGSDGDDGMTDIPKTGDTLAAIMVLALFGSLVGVGAYMTIHKEKGQANK